MEEVQHLARLLEEEEEECLPDLRKEGVPLPLPPSLVHAGTSSSLASVSGGINASTAMTSLPTSTRLYPRDITSQDTNLSGAMRGKGEYSRLCHRETINNNHRLSFSHPAHNFNLLDHNSSRLDLNSSLHHFNSFNNGSKDKQRLPLDGIRINSRTKATMHSPQYGGLLLVREVDHQKSLGDPLALEDPRSRGDPQAQVDPRSLKQPPAG